MFKYSTYCISTHIIHTSFGKDLPVALIKADLSFQLFFGVTSCTGCGVDVIVATRATLPGGPGGPGSPMSPRKPLGPLVPSGPSRPFEPAKPESPRVPVK